MSTSAILEVWPRSCPPVERRCWCGRSVRCPASRFTWQWNMGVVVLICDPRVNVCMNVYVGLCVVCVSPMSL